MLGTECSGIFLYGFSFSSTSRVMRRFSFAIIHCENQNKLLEVKLTKVWGPPCDYVFLELLTLRIVHTEPPASFQLQFSSPYPGSGAHGCLCSPIPVPLSSESLEPPACLSNSGDSICPVTVLLLQIEKKLLISSVCSSFYFLGWSGNLQTPYFEL